jgi:hypothetical protein
MGNVAPLAQIGTSASFAARVGSYEAQGILQAIVPKIKVGISETGHAASMKWVLGCKLITAAADDWLSAVSFVIGDSLLPPGLPVC